MHKGNIWKSEYPKTGKRLPQGKTLFICYSAAIASALVLWTVPQGCCGGAEVLRLCNLSVHKGIY